MQINFTVSLKISRSALPSAVKKSHFEKKTCFALVASSAQQLSASRLLLRGSASLLVRGVEMLFEYRACVVVETQASLHTRFSVSHLSLNRLPSAPVFFLFCQFVFVSSGAGKLNPFVWFVVFLCRPQLSLGGPKCVSQKGMFKLD